MTALKGLNILFYKPLTAYYRYTGYAALLLGERPGVLALVSNQHEKASSP